MGRLRIFIVILFLIFARESVAKVQDTIHNKNVLVLFSLVPSTPAYRTILDGIRQRLSEEFGDAYNLHLEYLETERYPKGEYPKERFGLYNEKYRNVGLDLLICVGTNIIGTIKDLAEPYLLDLPAVSIDNDFSKYGYYSELALNKKTSVIAIKVDADKTIQSALALFPETTNIYFIAGISNADRIFATVSKQVAARIDKKIKVTFITDAAMDEILSLVRHLPEKSIILVASFNSDNKQVPYYNPEAVRLISRAANNPVFTYSDMGFGEGAVGGYIMSFRNAGLNAGFAAVKILRGANPSSLKWSDDECYTYQLDWRELKRWNLIGSGTIPAKSNILFEEITFFGKYRWIILAVIFFLILQTILIMKLVIMYRQQGIITLRLKESENKYRELVREDRILRIGQLTASLSHELNQPLTAILSMAQAGIRFIDSNNHDPELQKEILQNIVESDKRTASILSSIRGMMKLEKREKEVVDLVDVINELIMIYHSEAIEQNIKLELDLPPTPAWVLADRIQLQQVILNIISNAEQSMTGNSLNRKVITVKAFLNGDEMIVSVRDYGEGIPESLKDKLFKPFVSTRAEGVGIGLAISRSIIEDHNGKIWAENIPGGGAKISFSLKMYKGE